MIVTRARALAAAPYAPPPAASQDWPDLSCDDFCGIWFDTHHTLFCGTRGAVQAEFFVADLYFPHKVGFHAVEKDQLRAVPFQLRLFDTTDKFPALPEDGTGFSGLRLLGVLEVEDRLQQYAVFQGASYFRAIGWGQAYGLSAWGFALNTAADGPEELPVFRDVWIEAAEPGASGAAVHALMDSPLVAGAYRFTITKGHTTGMAVSARLFPRVDVTTVGIAPGTSMFLSSDINRTRFDDFREAVHDSDGLLILDADSIMGADSVSLMADRMAVEPALGLIQTVPCVLGGHTLSQRLQSVASEVYGTSPGRGVALWTGTEGNFLGHNALVRTRAFTASAGLPHLPGRAPWGGVILSHDFVEATLVSRAGWGVRMLPEASGSFEGTPETVPGYLRRYRRWCQGNMQHLRLLATPGLNIVSRLHLLQGAMAYLASVLWLALWAVSGQGGVLPDPFLSDPFMPVWPDLPPVSQAVLTGMVGLMLLGPKLLGITAHLRDGDFRPRQLPGFAISVPVEVALSILLAPALMVHQVRAVLRTLAGFGGGWMPYLTERPCFLTLLRFHLTEAILGAALFGLCALGRIDAWLLPVAASLVLTGLLSWLVQRDTAQGWPLRPLG